MRALQAATISVPFIQCSASLQIWEDERNRSVVTHNYLVFIEKCVLHILKKSQAHTHILVDSCCSVRYRALLCCYTCIFFVIMENLSPLYIEDESQQGDESTTNLYQAADMIDEWPPLVPHSMVPLAKALHVDHTVANNLNIEFKAGNVSIILSYQHNN